MKRFAYPLILIGIGFLLFSNTLFSGLFFDDITQIVNNPQVHSLSKIPSLFTSSLRVSETAYYYKPLFYTAYSLMYVFGNANPFFFHFIQIFFYSINSVLLYYIYCRFFSRKISFGLALLFLVYPINAEVATYIANLQDILFLFFGLISVLIIASKIHSPFKIIFSALFVLLSLLSKEAGILFLVITLAYVLLYKKGNLKLYILTNVFFLTIYYFLRNLAANNSFIIQHFNYPIKQMPFFDRLLISPKIIYSFIKDAFLPTAILPDVKWLTHPSLIQAVASSLFVILFTFLICMIGYFLRIKKSKWLKVYVFFAVWFFAGILLHSQLIALDVIFAKRWMYFPLAGMIGLLGISIEIVKGVIVDKKIRTIFTLLYVVCVAILMLQVFWINTRWSVG